MAMDYGAIAAGAIAGGIATEAWEKVEQEAKARLQGQTPEHGPVEMQMLVEIAANIEKSIKEAKKELCPPAFRTVILGNAASGIQYTLKRGGYAHVSLLAAASVTLTIRTAIGTINFNMNAGWNAFDFPDGVDILISGTGAAQQQTVILYFGDQSLDIAGV